MISMAGALPNIHVANNSPLIFLNYYLLKSIVYNCCPRPSRGGGRVGEGAGAIFPSSYMIAMLSLLILSGLVDPFLA